MLREYPDLDIGVYYGVAALDPRRYDYSRTETTSMSSVGMILPAVLSIGYNPFYKNKERSIVRLFRLLSFSVCCPSALA